jgi:uncharacterized protein YdaU (DUF1376 family)
MNYYPHHIGDFDRATRHLTRIERSVYRDLIELYYDIEKPLALDTSALCRKIIARSAEEVSAVEQVLGEFFTKDDGGWRHTRCDEEIAIYHAKAETARENGKKGGRPCKNPPAPQPQPNDNPDKPSGFSVGFNPEPSGNPAETGSQANQEPVTNNHKPVTKGKSKNKDSASGARFDAQAHLVSLGVDPQHAADWLAARKKKNLAPTLTAMEQAQHEAEKAAMVFPEAIKVAAGMGWGGFMAKWVEAEEAKGNHLRGAPGAAPVSKAQARHNGLDAAAAEFAARMAAKHGADGPVDAGYVPPNDGMTFDME